MARGDGRLRRAEADGGPRLRSAEGPEGGTEGQGPRQIQARPGTVLQGGRLKAYRPLPAGDRAVALADAIAAYRAGDYFEAHELLEPAWMGTADELERELYQGLIKLAAAGVHHVRGNPRGMANNLGGARQRLAKVLEASAPDAGLDLAALVVSIDEALVRLDAIPPAPPRVPGSPRFAYRPRVAVQPPLLVTR